MYKIYVQPAPEFDGILAISTEPTAEISLEVYLDEPTLNLSKLPGYMVDQTTEQWKLKFDQDKYDIYLKKKEKEEAIEAGKDKLIELQYQPILLMASDEDAYTMRYLYDEWKPKTKYLVDDRRRYGDNLYKCKQEHTSEEGPNRTPDYLPALWDLIAPEDPDLGTKDNPIIIPEPFSSMEYIKGKYYKQGNVLYLMDGPMVASMEDGAKVSLTYKPSDLVGQYFTVVEEE